MSQAIYVINLPDREDRRREMRAELARVEWFAEFFEATRPEDKGDFPSIGSRGCFLSHLSLLKNARSRGLDRVIILEDDLNFNAGFVERWPRVEQFLNDQDPEFFYPAHLLQGADGVAEIGPSVGIQCTHFVILNGNGIETAITGLETILSRPAGHPLGGPMHVDGAYSTIRNQNPDIKTFAHFPSLGHQRPSRTDVGDGHWMDRSSFGRPIASILRKIKNRVDRQ